MGRIALEEAACRLGMTVKLVQWFSRHATKRPAADSAHLQKLKIDADGQIEEDHLTTFDEHLRQAWPDRRVPTGVSQELRREAQGTCGLCESGCDTLVEAHIQRRGRELDFYCQHPHNLILLCRNCHGRYDELNSISVDVVLHAKERRLLRLTEAVRVDFRIMQGIEAAIHARLEDGKFTAEILDRALAETLAPVASYGTTDVEDELEFQEKLTTVSGTLAEENPVTAGLIAKFATQLGKGGLSLEKNEPWRIMQTAYVDCPACHGSGGGGYCDACRGEGEVLRECASGIEPENYDFVDCPACAGDVKIEACYACFGAGKVPRNYAARIDPIDQQRVVCPACDGQNPLCRACDGRAEVPREHADGIDPDEYRLVACPGCDGTGGDGNCRACAGRGAVPSDYASEIDPEDLVLVACPACSGTGSNGTCVPCNGDGYVPRMYASEIEP